METKIKLCVFIHFSTTRKVPYNVKFYVNELSKYYDEIRFLTNNEDNNSEIDFFKGNIIPEFDKNEGYDFGRIYNYLRKIKLENYEQIACINDSNILLGPLDKVMNWGKCSKLDFWGIIDSYQHPRYSKHKNHYHIQSHFIVFNKNAINHLLNYFQSVDLKFIFSIKDKTILRKQVINDWEIGLSQYIINNKLTLGAYKDCAHYSKRYSSGKPKNVSQKLYYELIKDDYPFLKKKVITCGKWYDWMLGKKYWKNVIRQHAHPSLKYDMIIDELLDAKLNT